ncbi:hypothetical protein ACFWP7_03490 [Streptomyces sp. NPDC058470]|uniref:hypothetical protein n=1 Tax=Streptomyces sp. NPDC058470 TaxID=3346515 RepID=UPI003668FBE9
MRSTVTIVTRGLALALVLGVGGAAQTFHAEETARAVAGDEGPSVGTPAAPARSGATAFGF